MSNININLTPYLKTYVDGKVKGGRYNNVSEVVREALRLMEQRDMTREAKLRDLRAAIEEGLNSGEPVAYDMAEIIAEAKHERASEHAH